MEQRPMTPAERIYWESHRTCQPHTRTGWNVPSTTVTPVLVPVIFGNGRQAYRLFPLATRPQHYIVIGDDRWLDDDTEDDLAWLEPVQEKIAWVFGDAWDEAEDGTMRHTDWPALNTSAGVYWEYAD